MITAWGVYSASVRRFEAGAGSGSGAGAAEADGTGECVHGTPRPYACTTCDFSWE